MNFEKLTLDGSVDTGALASAISEQDLNKIKLLAKEAISDTSPAPNFQIMVTNAQLETPIGTVCLTLEVTDFLFKEIFILMKVLNLPNFPILSKQMKPEHNIQTRPTTFLLAEATYTLHSGETLLIASRMPHLIGHDATGIVTPSAQLEVHDTRFLVSSLSRVNNNAVGYQIYNFSELPYSITTDTHLADFRILTRTTQDHDTC